MKMQMYALLLFTLFGCARQSSQDIAQTAESRRRLISQERMIEELRNENRLLKQLVQNRPAVPAVKPPVARQPEAKPPVPVAKASPVSNVNTPAPEPAKSFQLKSLKEDDLLRQALESYQQNDLERLRQIASIVEAQYSHGVFVDDVLYYLGMLSYTQGQFEIALTSFDSVVNKYPFSNKRSSSLFAKAMTLKKMGMKQDAKTQLEEVSTAYPGSLEAQRARLELRLIDQAKQ